MTDFSKICLSELGDTMDTGMTDNHNNWHDVSHTTTRPVYIDLSGFISHDALQAVVVCYIT